MNLIKELYCALKKGMHYIIITAAIASSIITAISAFAAVVGLGPGLIWMRILSGRAKTPSAVGCSVVAAVAIVGLIGCVGLILDHQRPFNRPYRCYYPDCAASRSSSRRLHEV